MNFLTQTGTDDNRKAEYLENMVGAGEFPIETPAILAAPVGRCVV